MRKVHFFTPCSEIPLSLHKICRKEADGTYTVLASYYVNNLPQSITYDGTAVYWDLSKEKSEFIGNNIVLRFSVVQINETGFSIRSTENP